MSKISNLIFNDSTGKNHYMTSPYGARNTISTSAGKTSSFHNGTDYGTHNKKLPQYAIEDGYIFAAGTSSSDGAKYVWVIYPRIELAFLHYHLDTISVKAGDKVKKGTKLGTTGKSGKATGIHLHLGIRALYDLNEKTVQKMSWDALRSMPYVDPEKVVYYAPVPAPKKKYTTGKYTVNAKLLNVRSGAGTSYPRKTFKKLTVNAQAQILKLNNNKEANGLVKGCTCTVSEIKNNIWGKIPSGWICLDYCKKV